jgi:hypothetical protein
MDIISAGALLGFVMVVVGALMFVASFIPSKLTVSRKVAGWLVAVGLLVLFAYFLFVLWLVSQVGALGE